MKLRYLLLAGALAFVGALLAQAPAALVYAWTFAKQPDAPIRLYGVDGTAVAGRALQASRGAQPLLRQLNWQWQPSALLLGRAAYHLQTQAPPLLLDGTLAVGPTGTRVSDLKASGELRSVAGMFGQTFVPVTGEVGLQIERLRMSGDWPVDAQGEVRAIGLAWALGREPVALGDYQAAISTQDGGDIVATVSTLAGVVDVSGEARLRPDRSYEFDLKLRPRPDAPAVVSNLLRQLGPADADGSYRLRQTGADAPVEPATAAAAPPPALTPPRPGVRNIDGVPVPDSSASSNSRAPASSATPAPSGQDAPPSSEGGYLVVE